MKEADRTEQVDFADWHVTLRVLRYKQNGQPPGWENFTVEVRPTEYVVDALERIWAAHDRSLVFRHACHHAACGACGVRINGREQLACITRIDALVGDGGMMAIEPLRRLPVVSDLVVDAAPFYRRMERIPFVVLRSADPITDEETGVAAVGSPPPQQFENCIECALCFSACPITGTNPDWVGPAALAAMGRMMEEPRPDLSPRSGFEAGDRGGGIAEHVREAGDEVFLCLLCRACEASCPTGVPITEGIHTLRRFLLKEGW
ncbi:MAG: 2Fe-2S iron-sulfur cluster-binding protein [Candidatus Dormibacteria bacterium]|jgi:succinate dehydrogenase / fumarate reductase iron-sulfur subunit